MSSRPRRAVQAPSYAPPPRYKHRGQPVDHVKGQIAQKIAGRRRSSNKSRKRATLAAARGHIDADVVARATESRRVSRVMAEAEQQRRDAFVASGLRPRRSRSVSAPHSATPPHLPSKKRAKSASSRRAKQLRAGGASRTALATLLTEAEIMEFDEWIQENRDVKDAANLTLARMRAHLKERYNILVGEQTISKFVRNHLHYECVDPSAGGYVANRGRLASTKAHLAKLVPLLEFMEANPDLFVVAYYDESTPHQNQFAPHVWTKERGFVKNPEDRMVNRRSGKGPAISVSGAVSYHENGIIKDADGIHIGQWKEASKTRKVSHFQLRSSSFLCVALLPDFCIVVIGNCRLYCVPHFLTFDW